MAFHFGDIAVISILLLVFIFKSEIRILQFDLLRTNFSFKLVLQVG